MSADDAERSIANHTVGTFSTANGTNLNSAFYLKMHDLLIENTLYSSVSYPSPLFVPNSLQRRHAEP